MSQHLYHSTDHPSGMSNHHTYMHRASNTRILLHVQVHYRFAQRARRTKSHSPRHRGSPRRLRVASRTPSHASRSVRKDRAQDRSHTATGSRTRYCVARSWLLGPSAHRWAHGPDELTLPVSRPAQTTAVLVPSDIKDPGPQEACSIRRRGSSDHRPEMICVTECRDESGWSVNAEASSARDATFRAQRAPEAQRRPRRSHKQRQVAPWWSWTPCLLPLPGAAFRDA